MGNIIVGLIILLIIALSIFKVIGDKKKGVKCTGCAQGGSCASKPPPAQQTKALNSASIEVKELK